MSTPGRFMEVKIIICAFNCFVLFKLGPHKIKFALRIHMTFQVTLSPSSEITQLGSHLKSLGKQVPQFEVKPQI